MPPEAMNGKPVPFKNDIYSLGLTIYFIINKELPEYENRRSEIFEIPPKYSILFTEMLSIALK